MPRKGERKRRERPGDDPFGISAYLDSLRVKNYSEATIQTREHYLGIFARWCAERGVGQAAEVTKPVLERYQRWLFHYRKKNGEPLSFRSQAGHQVPVRALFKWLARENRILYNPASELELPKMDKRLPKHVLSLAEVETVLSQPDLSDPLGVRDRAMLETFYSTGMRRMELARLAVADVDHDRGTVMIRQGKGKKDRMVPIGERALAWIAKYAGDVRPQLVAGRDPGTLFLTGQGEVFSVNRLTQLVREYVAKADLGKTGSCHLLRHTMATLMLEGGADIRYIQEMLGHAKLETTQIYTQVSIMRLKAVHASCHPGAGLERRAQAPAHEDAAEQEL